MLETEIKKLTVAMTALTAALQASPVNMDVAPQAEVPNEPVATPDPQPTTQVTEQVTQPEATVEPSQPAMTHEQAIQTLGGIAKKMGDAAQLGALIPKIHPGAAKVSDLPVEKLPQLISEAEALVA